jgi:hypothetical protein
VAGVNIATCVTRTVTAQSAGHGVNNAPPLSPKVTAGWLRRLVRVRATIT